MDWYEMVVEGCGWGVSGKNQNDEISVFLNDFDDFDGVLTPTLLM